ncbi:hypothetical protein DY000_02060448 [Brassica cretica]|uniref:Uncharacterized protein n=1 Tax=Brassica cretica TaxID=69181 RepID=A0ABQ7AYA2_BRACR|nr:hypothetical protein DY000_02060448 [Brassica cretica]
MCFRGYCVISSSGDLRRIGLWRKPRRATKATQPQNPIGRIPVAHVIISGFLRRLSRGIVGLGGYLGNYGGKDVARIFHNS